MRKLIAIVAILTLGMAGIASADSLPMVQAKDQPKMPWTVTVYNDSGTELVSGSVVVWDQADSNLVDSFYPYVTTTTTADDIWTAGVIYGRNCQAGELCEIVVYGPVDVVCDDSSDAVAASTTVGTTTTAGRCGDYTPAANKRSLGVALEAGTGHDNDRIAVWVNTLGAPAEQ